MQSKDAGTSDALGKTRQNFSRSPHREDALRAIESLEDIATLQVPSGVHLHFGNWLGWPPWLLDGSSYSSVGFLPQRIALADDLIVSANLLDHVGMAKLCSYMTERLHPLVGPRTTNLVMSAPNLGDMIKFIVDFGNISSIILFIKFEKNDKNINIIIDVYPSLGRLIEFYSFLSLLTIFKFTRMLAQGKAKDSSIELTSTTLSAAALAPAISPHQLNFGARENRFIFPAEWIDLPNPEHDPSTWALAQEGLQTLEHAQRNARVIELIRSKVADSLDKSRRVLRLKEIATEEGVSSRTIIRSLSANGTSFHEIVEGERRRLAKQLIADPAISLASVAEALGFTDRSSFGRSFRKWFGETPGQYRLSEKNSQPRG